MLISIQIPNDVACALAVGETDLSRAAIEALAIVGYQQDRLSEHQVAQMLGFGGRMEVHAFLKTHKVPLNYSMDDLQQDIRALSEFEAILRA